MSGIPVSKQMFSSEITSEYLILLKVFHLSLKVLRELRHEGPKFIYHTAQENLSYFGTLVLLYSFLRPPVIQLSRQHYPFWKSDTCCGFGLFCSKISCKLSGWSLDPPIIPSLSSPWASQLLFQLWIMANTSPCSWLAYHNALLHKDRDRVCLSVRNERITPPVLTCHSSLHRSLHDAGQRAGLGAELKGRCE